MAGSFGKIIVGVYVEIKRSDGKFSGLDTFRSLGVVGEAFVLLW